MNYKQCLCDGANEECMFCGGTGKIKSNEIEIIKIVPTQKEKTDETNELEVYLHNKDEKMYVVKDTSHLGLEERLKFNRKQKRKLAKLEKRRKKKRK